MSTILNVNWYLQHLWAALVCLMELKTVFILPSSYWGILKNWLKSQRSRRGRWGQTNLFARVMMSVKGTFTTHGSFFRIHSTNRFCPKKQLSLEKFFRMKNSWQIQTKNTNKSFVEDPQTCAGVNVLHPTGVPQETLFRSFKHEWRLTFTKWWLHACAADHMLTFWLCDQCFGLISQI